MKNNEKSCKIPVFDLYKTMNLKEIKKRSGKTQLEIAKELGVTRRTIQRWLSDDAATPDHVTRLLEIIYFGTDPNTEKNKNKAKEILKLTMTGFFDQDALNGKKIEDLIGEKISIKSRDENENIIEIEGILEKVLEKKEIY